MTLIDTGGVQGGPKDTGTIGVILVEPRGDHQEEQVSWNSVQGDPWYDPGGACVSNTIKCGGW